MKIKKATFWDIDYSNDVVGDKSAIDKLNEYIVENQISKCDVINIESRGNDRHSRFFNLFKQGIAGMIFCLFSIFYTQCIPFNSFIFFNKSIR